MGKRRLFNLNDQVILRSGQKGLIFRIPDCTIDPGDRLCVCDDDPIYSVLYVDDKGFHFGPYDVNESGMKLYSENETNEPKNKSGVYGAVNINPIHRIEKITCPHCGGETKVSYYDSPCGNGEHRRHLMEFVSTMDQKINKREVLYLRDTSYSGAGFTLEKIRVLVWNGEVYIEWYSDDNVKYSPEWLRMILTTNSDLNKVYQLVDIYGFTNYKKEN